MADLKILVTGAAGYMYELIFSYCISSADTRDSGGSVVAALLSENDYFQRKNLFAAVRAEEQVQSLQPLAINVLRLNVKDEQAVAKAVLQNESMSVIATVP